MLTEVAEGVLVHESAWVQTSTVVVRGGNGALLVDPGIHAAELTCLASDIAALGDVVVAGFSTHPHWDHLLWHPGFGAVPRYATALAADTARERLAGGLDARRFGIPEDVPLDLLGRLDGLPAGATRLPGVGGGIRIVEHAAHSAGHAALLVESSRVLVAGDMLSDVLIPMLDQRDSADPIGDYLSALDQFEAVADDVDLVIPGHGSVGSDIRSRIDRDRAYVVAFRDGLESQDARVGSHAKPGWEWVADVHARQVEALRGRSG